MPAGFSMYLSINDFLHWCECLKNALGSTKQSSCDCSNIWQYSCIVVFCSYFVGVVVVVVVVVVVYGGGIFCTGSLTSGILYNAMLDK